MIGSQEIDVAAKRMLGHVRQTPALAFDTGAFGVSGTAILKLEMLQHTGSFKCRGAFNRLLSLSEIPAAGVIAASGGNHGAAVAYAARELGSAAEIFVPAATPAAKIARISGFGACVVVGGATYHDAWSASQERQVVTGAIEIHAYDDDAVIAGQGTVAREFEAQAPALTHVLVATGGGGLIGGMAAWYASRVTVISVEPIGCPSLHDALAAGRPVASPAGGLAADSLGAREVGGRMFAIARAHVAQAVLVTDGAIRDAQRMLWDHCRLIVEPGGAVALAGLLSGAFVPPPGARVGIVLCGANTDPATMTTEKAAP